MAEKSLDEITKKKKTQSVKSFKLQKILESRDPRHPEMTGNMKKKTGCRLNQECLVDYLHSDNG